MDRPEFAYPFPEPALAEFQVDVGALYIEDQLSGHSTTTCRVWVADENGAPVAGARIDLDADRGRFLSEGIESLQVGGLSDSKGMFEALFTASYVGSIPGKARIRATVNRFHFPNMLLAYQVDIVGPAAPNGVTIRMAPASLLAGELATIIVSVRDSIGQPVRDQTLVRFASNADARFTSDESCTYSGIATNYLFTRPGISGKYPVTVTVIGLSRTAPIVAQATVEVEGGNVELNPVSQVFNTTINQGSHAINIGGTGPTFNLAVNVGEIDGLRAALGLAGVTPAEIAELEPHLDLTSANGELSPSVQSWISRVSARLGGGASAIGVGASGSLLANAIWAFLGGTGA